MTLTVALLTAAGSVIALAAACAVVANATAALRKDVDDLKARDRFAAPPMPEGGGRGPQRMMGALYPEGPSLLERLTGVPAWPGFAAAAVLALAGGLLGLAASPPAPPVAVERQTEIATLRATVDSMTGEVRRLSDSLRLAVASSAKPATRLAATTARPPRRATPGRAASVSAAPLLPPPPSLQPMQAGTPTVP